VVAASSTNHPSLPLVVTVVALGGAAGAVLRALVGELAPTSPHDFPWPTLAINVAGSALLALLPALDAVRRRPLLPPLLGTGLLGGFTTLSVWAQETHDLLDAGRAMAAAGYAMGTLVACLAVVALVDRLSTPDERVAFDAEEGDL
jgi:fluoride exporter